MTKASKGKIRAGLFAGVFGLVCLLITLFVASLYTSTLPTSFEIAMSVVAVLTMWMVFVGTYIGLTILDMANSQ